MAESLLRDAMLGFELFKKLARRPKFSFFHVFQALTDAFFHIEASGDIAQFLIKIVLSNVRDGLLFRHLL